MMHSAKLKELSLLNSPGQERISSVLLCLRLQYQIPQGSKKSFFLKTSPPCTLKEDKKKKAPNAKYCPVHIVLPQRVDERKSKPHVTDVSHITKCSAGRSCGKRAVKEPTTIFLPSQFQIPGKDALPYRIYTTCDCFLFCCQRQSRLILQIIMVIFVCKKTVFKWQLIILLNNLWSFLFWWFLSCAIQGQQFPNLHAIPCKGVFWFLLLCQANATVAMAMAMFESALSPLSCYSFFF